MDSTLTQVYEWHKVFTDHCEVIESLSHLSRPSTDVNDDNIGKINETMLENHRVDIRVIPHSTHLG